MQADTAAQLLANRGEVVYGKPQVKLRLGHPHGQAKVSALESASTAGSPQGGWCGAAPGFSFNDMCARSHLSLLSHRTASWLP